MYSLALIVFAVSVVLPASLSADAAHKAGHSQCLGLLLGLLLGWLGYLICLNFPKKPGMVEGISTRPDHPLRERPVEDAKLRERRRSTAARTAGTFKIKGGSQSYRSGRAKTAGAV